MKIYTKTYSEKYEQIAKASTYLTVAANSKTCFAVPYPSEGIMETVVFSQVSTDSTRVAATLEVFNSQIPFPPGDYDVDDEAADKEEHYRIIPPITIIADAVGAYDATYGHGFTNIDGGWTLNQRYVYVLIIPSESSTGPQGPQDEGAAVATHWNVTIKCRTDIG